MRDRPHTRAPQHALQSTAKETPMNFLADFGLVAALATGYLVAGLVGAVVLARIALAARDWLNRNDR